MAVSIGQRCLDITQYLYRDITKATFLPMDVGSAFASMDVPQYPDSRSFESFQTAILAVVWENICSGPTVITVPCGARGKIGHDHDLAMHSNE